jgi:transcriptional regulator with GAF, ATPase, and Fis domain
MCAASHISTTTRASPDQTMKPVLRVRRLLVVFGPRCTSQSPTLLVTGQPLLIGRSGAADGALGLDDPEVSRRHARLEPDLQDGTDWIVDTDSRNGTFVDGARVRRTRLSHGSVVRVGASLLIYTDVLVPADAPLTGERHNLLGGSVAMHLLRGEIQAMASGTLPALVLGETGVGKELVARAIHTASGRTGRFVAVNCATVTESLADSELFGHLPGSFTGAARRNDGLVMAAHEGTLFLDEVGEMPAPVQAKLLRTLATGEVRAVGASEIAQANVRLVAATLRELSQEVITGGFRVDLLARVAAWTIQVPPLRHRRDDILHLASTFLNRLGPGGSLAVDAAEALLLYHWPANVRELEHAVAVAATRAGPGQPIRREHLPDAVGQVRISAARTDPESAAATGAASAQLPLELLVPCDHSPDARGLAVVLDRFGGNVAAVAEYFGKDRRQVYRWIERYGIDLSARRA